MASKGGGLRVGGQDLEAGFESLSVAPSPGPTQSESLAGGSCDCRLQNSVTVSESQAVGLRAGPGFEAPAPNNAFSADPDAISRLGFERLLSFVERPQRASGIPGLEGPAPNNAVILL